MFIFHSLKFIFDSIMFVVIIFIIILLFLGYNDTKHNTKAENDKLEQIVKQENKLSKTPLFSKKRQEIKHQIDELKGQYKIMKQSR